MALKDIKKANSEASKAAKVDKKPLSKPVAPKTLSPKSVTPESLKGVALVKKIKPGEPSKIKIGKLKLARVDEPLDSFIPGKGQIEGRKHVAFVLEDNVTREQVEAKLAKFTGPEFREDAWAYVEYEDGGKVHKLLVECGENEGEGAAYMNEVMLAKMVSSRSRKIKTITMYHNHPQPKLGDGVISFHPISNADIEIAIKNSYKHWLKKNGAGKKNIDIEYGVVTAYGVYRMKLNPALASHSWSKVSKVMKKATESNKTYGDNPHDVVAAKVNIPNYFTCSFSYFDPAMKPVVDATHRYTQAIKAHNSGKIDGIFGRQLGWRMVLKRLAELKAEAANAKAMGSKHELISIIEMIKLTDDGQLLVS